MSGQALAVRRKCFGLVDSEQERFIDTLLAGSFSISHAAERSGVAVSTAAKWCRHGHYVRAEIERRIEARRRVLDGLVKLADDPKASPSTRLEAARLVMQQIGMTPADVKQQRWEKAPSVDMIRLLKVMREEDQGEGGDRPA
jgi:hypothetical protein